MITRQINTDMGILTWATVLPKGCLAGSDDSYQRWDKKIWHIMTLLELAI